MNNYVMETKEFKEQKSAIKGISFIKSRKAYINVLGINKDIYNSAKKNGIEIDMYPESWTHIYELG